VNLQYILFVFGLSLVVAYGLMHVLYIGLHYPIGEWAKRLWDSESYPNDSLLDAITESLALRWRRWRTRPSKNFRSPSRRYRLKQFLAAGDLCDVYLAKSQSNDIVLKIPRNSKGEPFLRREVECLGQLRSLAKGESYLKYLPKPIERFRYQDRYLTAFEHEAGFLSARDLRSCFPNGLPDEHIAWMFNRTLEILGFIHQQGLVHGAILPTHLLFHPETHGLQLIGWTHAVRVGEPIVVVPGDYRHWYPPECARKEPATSATDIYLAAKTMLWLSGGDADSNRFPATMSDGIRQFLTDCLEPNNALRPNNAWTLHRDFRALLNEQFGPPTFQDLWVA
jgi:hypothetical protein